MKMKDAIVARRSVRTYTGEPLRESVLDELMEYISHIKPLHDNIPVDIEICGAEDFHKDFARSLIYRGSYFIVLRSARTIRGYLPNIGFIGEQIILWLTHKGIGSCWVGMAKQRSLPARGELPYVMAIQFGRSDNAPFRRLPEESPRKNLHELLLNEISRPEFLKLMDAGRLAPSAMNFQPVRYYTKDDDLYILRRELPLRSRLISDLQQIDVGTAMANMYVMCDGQCTFVRQSEPPTLPSGCLYEYTLRLKKDG